MLARADVVPFLRTHTYATPVENIVWKLAEICERHSQQVYRESNYAHITSFELLTVELDQSGVMGFIKGGAHANAPLLFYIALSINGCVRSFVRST